MNKKILIVDDEKEIVDLLEVYLRTMVIQYINVIMG